MTYTKEFFDKLCDVADQACIAKYGLRADAYHLHDEGLTAEFYCRGSDSNYEDLSVKDLNADFEQAIAERKAKEAEQRLKAEEKRREQAEEAAERKKIEEYNEYMRLKRKFEG